MRPVGTLLLLFVAFPTLAFSQAGWGTLAAPPGQHGVWIPPNAGDERLVELDSTSAAPVNPFAIESNPLQRTPRAAVASVPSFRKLKVGEIPFQPWARALYDYRQGNQFEPHTRCKPSGGPRQFLTPYGVDFVELPELKRVLIADIGGPHTLRVIHVDESHPADLAPSSVGHSIGRWEGETLMVDTIGFNERFWIDRWGLPHTQRLHVVERFTRVDATTLKYEVTVDDLGAYTAPWTSGLLLRWDSTQELFEYVCQDNNLAPEMMVGTSEKVDRTSVIVP
jgi:hypothetical protein